VIITALITEKKGVHPPAGVCSGCAPLSSLLIVSTVGRGKKGKEYSHLFPSN